jgi:hypothetical protein
MNKNPDINAMSQEIVAFVRDKWPEDEQTRCRIQALYLAFQCIEGPRYAAEVLNYVLVTTPSREP